MDEIHESDRLVASRFLLLVPYDSLLSAPGCGSGGGAFRRHGYEDRDASVVGGGAESLADWAGACGSAERDSRGLGQVSISAHLMVDFCVGDDRAGGVFLVDGQFFGE